MEKQGYAANRRDQIERQIWKKVGELAGGKKENEKRRRSEWRGDQSYFASRPVKVLLHTKDPLFSPISVFYVLKYCQRRSQIIYRLSQSRVRLCPRSKCADMMMELFHRSLLISSVVVFACFCGEVGAKGDDFKPRPIRDGPWVSPSKGAIWPKPQFRFRQDLFFDLDPIQFELKVW